MSFQRSVHSLPRLLNYEQALNAFNNIVPIRGRSIRPLDYRRGRRDVTIEYRERSGAVEVWYYNTCIITYFPDGTLNLNPSGWDSVISTRNVIARISGVELLRRYDITWVSCKWEDRELSQSMGGWLVLCDQPAPLKLKIVQHSPYRVEHMLTTPPVYPVKYTTNRKALNGMMKPYKEFLQYVHVKQGLLGGVIPRENVVGYDKDNPGDWTKFNPENLGFFVAEKDYESALLCAMRYGYSYGGYVSVSTNTKTVRDVVKFTLLKTHKDTLFTEEVIKSGQTTRVGYPYYL